MTAKRFTVPKNYRCIQDNLTKEHYLCEDKTEAINLAYLLNELSDENEQLRIEKDTIQKQHSYEIYKKLEYKSELIDLKKENEQLKHSIKCLEADKMELQQYIKRMQGD